jgi:hypothetical protein
MTSADRAIRSSTIAAVVVVAAAAASVSYRHALQVVGQHGESGWLDAVYPLTVDGLIYASSVVLLDDARRGLTPHWLAYCALALGISAALAVNVAAGLAFGTVGAIVAARPAPALVISYKLLMLIVRRSAVPATEPGALAAGNGAPAHLIEAQRKFADEIGEHKVPTIRQIRSGLSVGAAKAAEAQRHLTVLAQSNGHG